MMAQVNEIARLWWDWMGPMFWQISLLIILISCIDILIRRWAWPQVRYALWLLVLLKLVIPPTWSLPTSVVSYVQPQVSAIIQSRLKKPERTTDSAQTTSLIPNTTFPITTPESSVSSSTSRERLDSSAFVERSVKPIWQTYAMGIWLLGILGFLGVLIGKMMLLRRWHQLQKEKSIPQWFHELLVQTSMQLKLQRLPAIVFSKQAKTPAVYGMFRPVLLLPAHYFDNLSQTEAEHVLLHELAHLKRGDLWLHGLCLFLQMIYWFNPLMIWVRKQMKHVREICCDLTVAHILRDKTIHYRQTLLNTARGLLTESVEPGLGLLGVFEEPFRLVTRLKWLEKKTWQNRRLVMATALSVSFFVFVCFMPMAGAKKELPVQLTREAKTGSVQNQRESFFEYSGKSPSREVSKGFDIQITMKKIEPLYAAVLPRVGSHDEFEKAVNELKRRLNEVGIQPSGHPFGRFFSNPEEVSKWQSSWEVGFPVPVGTEVEAPLEIIRLSSQQVATATIEGKKTDHVWQEFIEAIQDRGYIPAFPPAIEIWSGTEEGREFWWRTEMQIQAFRPEIGYPGLEIRVRKTESFSAVVLPMQGSYAQHGEAVEKLERYIREKEISTTGDPFGRYFSDASKVTPAEYFWEVGYPIAEGAKVDPPFEIRQIAGSIVASAVISGPPEVEYPWAPFVMQLLIQGKMPVGPALEIWSGDPEKTGEEGPTVEMRMPVIPMGDFGEGMKEWGQAFGKAMGEWGVQYGKSMQQWGEDYGQAMEERERSNGEDEKSNKDETEQKGFMAQVLEKASEMFGRLFGDRTAYSDSRFDIEIKNAPAFSAVILPMRGSYDQLHEAMRRLQNFLEARGIKPTGPSFLRQMSIARIENPEYEFVWEVGYPVPEGTRVHTPFELRTFPAAEVSSMRMTGAFDEDIVNQEWAAWFYENNYRPTSAALIFCPDRLYKSSRSSPEWEMRIAIEKWDEPYPDVDVYTKWTEPLLAMVLPMHGSYEQEPDALQMLKNYLNEINFTPTGDPFIRYFNDPTCVLEDELLWEVGFPAPKEIGAKSPFEIKSIADELVAYTIVECGYEEVEKYYYAFALLTASNGYLATGYPIITLRDKKARGWAKREIRVPIRRKRQNPIKLPIF